MMKNRLKNIQTLSPFCYGKWIWYKESHNTDEYVEFEKTFEYQKGRALFRIF